MNKKLLLIPKILLILSDSVLIAVTQIEDLWSIEYGFFIRLFPLIAISIVSFFKPRFGGILVIIASILTFIVYLWQILYFFNKFFLADMFPIPLLLIFYLFIGILLIVFSGKKKENETESTK